MTEGPAHAYIKSEDFLLHVKQNWRLFVVFGLLGAAVGGTTSILLPSYYRSNVAFQAEPGAPAQLSGALAGLASQLGALQPGTQSSPQLFADLLSTDAVLRRVIQARLPWNGDSVDLSRIYGYSSKPTGQREFYTVRKLRQAMTVGVNIRTGVVTFAVEARTPELALALANSTIEALNDANIALRQARAAAERTFTSDRSEFARGELAGAERALAEFYDRNRIVNSPKLQLEESRLKRAVDMAQQVFVQLRLQAEQAAVQEVRNTPSISVIDPPILPVKRSWPNRRLAAIAGLLVGLAIGFTRTIVRA